MALKFTELRSRDNPLTYDKGTALAEIEEAPSLDLGYGRCTKCSCKNFDSLKFSEVCQNPRCGHYIHDHEKKYGED